MRPEWIYGIAISGATTPLIWLWLLRWRDRRARRRREQEIRELIGATNPWWGKK